MTRFLTRLFLAASLLISIWVAVFAVNEKGYSEPETWAVIAAVLAVITAAFSSWSAQKSLELQEDALKAYPYPFIDIKSRYGLMQLRVKNFGGSVAHDIRIRWDDKPLMNSRGEEIHFTKVEGAPDIGVLLPGESIAILVDGSLQAYETYQDMNYSGKIEFRDASGRKKKRKFYMSAEQYRHTLTYEQEEPKAFRDIQKIPEELKKINSQLLGIQSAMNNLVELEREDD